MRENLYQWLSNEASPNSTGAVEKFIVQLVSEIPLPISGQCCLQFSSSSNDEMLYSLPSSRHPLCSTFSLDHLFSTLSIDTIIGVIATILFESRIIFYSSSLSSITIIIHSFLQLVYPLQWSGVFIPLLPLDMIDAYDCPQP